MAIEKNIRAITAQSFTADGTSLGVVTLNNVRSFYIRHQVIVKADGQSDLNLEVKDITDINTLTVGPRDGDLTTTTNISAYTTAANATIEAPEQGQISSQSASSATVATDSFEPAPTNARRSGIVGKLGDSIAEVTSRKGFPPGLHVYTTSYDDTLGDGNFFINETFGADMNQDAGFTGTPDGIHNGTDSALWTGSNLTGTSFVFNSTDQAFAGTRSVYSGTNPSDGDEALFTRASVVSSGSYVALTGAVYLTRWGVDDDIKIRFRNGGTDVGVELSLSTYINSAELNSWQQFTIPLDSFISSSSNIDQMVIKVVNITATSPRVYFDSLELQELGGSLAYTFSPATGTEFQVTGITIGIVATLDSTFADSSLKRPSMPKLAYNKILSENKLATGIVSLSVINNVLAFSGVYRQFMDFLMTPDTMLESGSDGTTTWVRFSTSFDVDGGSPLLLNADNGDYLQFIVNDDLSNLLYFRIIANGKKQTLVDGVNK